jgi:hypothetical protein
VHTNFVNPIEQLLNLAIWITSGRLFFVLSKGAMTQFQKQKTS